MKSHVLVSYIVIAALALSFAWSGAAAPDRTALHSPGVQPSYATAAAIQPSIAIFGRVSDAQGQALAGLHIQAVLPNGQVAGETLTGPAGQYEFGALPTAPYKLRLFDRLGTPLEILAGISQTDLRTAQSPRPHDLVVLLHNPSQLGEADKASAVANAVQSEGTEISRTAQILATGQITGVVTAADSGLPLWFATATAYNAQGNYAGSDYTDQQGRYIITGLDTGNYTVEFVMYSGNYIPEWYDNHPDQAGADPVQVTDGVVTANIDAALETGGQITGQVTAADGGAPLDDVTVVIYDAQGNSIQYAYTDANGIYTATQLLGGEYRVGFAPQSYGASGDYIGEYYNDQPDLDSADVITVGAGAVASGIDAVLQRGAKITGQVTAADGGAPLDDVTVILYDTLGDSVEYAYTNASGTYTATQLLGGEYRVGFAPQSYGASGDYIGEYYNNQPDLVSADVITVGAGAVVSGIDAVLQRGAKITGQVTAADGGAPLEDVTVYVYDTLGDISEYAYTDANGVYTATQLLSGSYRVEFEPQSYGNAADYLSEFYNDKFNLSSADVITVGAGAVVGGIDAVLARGAKITGQVTAADGGAPLDDVTVILYDTLGDSVEYAYTNASGTYTATQLLGGSYRVEFAPQSYGVSADYITEYYNDQPDLVSADAIPVGVGAVVSGIDAVLARGGKITGQVTAADGGAPLEDVTVRVYNALGDIVEYAYTNASGIYTATQLLSGSYWVEFAPQSYGVSADYLAEYYNDQPDLASADIVQVTQPGTTSGIDAVLARGGRITGQVTAADGGAPLEDVSIDIYDCVGRRVGYAWTDAQGVYTSTVLASGAYRLYLDPESWGVSYAYLGEYYNNQLDLASATPVNVSAPQYTSGINAVLARGAQFSGHITAQDSSLPLEGVQVTVYDEDRNYISARLTDSNGVYTTTGLLSGDYKLRFQAYSGPSADYVPEYYNNQYSWDAATLLSITAPNLRQDIDAVLARGGKISGRVTAQDNGLPLEDVWVDIYDSNWDYVMGEFTGASGVYTVTGLLSGSYWVSFDADEEGPSADYASEYYNNTIDSNLAQAVPVTAPDAILGIDAALQLGGKILCHVTAGDTGLPLHDVYVDADPQGPGFYTYAWTDLQGDCVLPGLHNDNYKVYFDDEYVTTYEGCTATTTYYTSEYYNDKPDWSNADLVPVPALGVVDGIDAILGVGIAPTPAPTPTVRIPLYLPVVEGGN